MLLNIYLFLVFIIIGLVLGLAMMGAGISCSQSIVLIVPKTSPYECGFDAFEECAYPI